MITLITLLHILVCVFLILVVLLQSGSKADLASAFGGASTQTAFGSRGPASFLHKVTVGCAIVFMITCLSLTIFSTRVEKTVVKDKPAAASKSGSTPSKAPAKK